MGPVESGLAVIAIFVAGVIGYQFADIRDDSQDTLANADQEAEVSKESEIVAKQEEKPAEEVKVPAEEKPEETKPAETEAESEAETEKPESTKPEPTQISISTKARQDNSMVIASATLDRALTGTCTFMFKNEGREPVKYQVTINNETSCAKPISVAEFDEAGEWKMLVTFVSKDMAFKGYDDTSVNISN